MIKSLVYPELPEQNYLCVRKIYGAEKQKKNYILCLIFSHIIHLERLAQTYRISYIIS